MDLIDSRCTLGKVTEGIVHLDFSFYFFFWHATMLCLISFSLLLCAFVHLFVYLLFVLFFFGFLIWRSRAQ